MGWCIVIIHQACHQCGAKMPPSMGNLCRRCQASVEQEGPGKFELGCLFLPAAAFAVAGVCWFFNL